MLTGLSEKWKYLLLFLIICDVVYTYIQNSNTMLLDGDLAAIIVPSDTYKRVLDDPFGAGVIFHHENYAAPNRFFIHFFMQKYFHFMPFVFQLISRPVESVFSSIVFARTFMHVFLIYLIAAIGSGSRNILNYKFLIVALVITPLFQVNGYFLSMAVTMNSVTYTFFYSLPLIFMLLYFYPFIETFYRDKSFPVSCLKNQFLVLLAFFIAFGGPLGPPSVIILIALILCSFWVKHFMGSSGMDIFTRIKLAFKAVPIRIWLHFSFIVVLCFYSLYIGTYNSENLWDKIPLKERYHMLWEGLFRTFTKKLGVPVLFGLCVLNGILIYRLKIDSYRKTLNLISLLGIFALIYLLLLPLGGYRVYREFIIRFDTFTPVTIVMMLVFGLTFLQLLIHTNGKLRNALIGIFVIMATIYTNADRYEKGVNKCQKYYLKEIAKSNEKVVPLYGWCSLLTWDKSKNPEDSELGAEMIRRWKITKEKKLYYHAD